MMKLAIKAETVTQTYKPPSSDKPLAQHEPTPPVLIGPSATPKCPTNPEESNKNKNWRDPREPRAPGHQGDPRHLQYLITPRARDKPPKPLAGRLPLSGPIECQYLNLIPTRENIQRGFVSAQVSDMTNN